MKPAACLSPFCVKTVAILTFGWGAMVMAIIGPAMYRVSPLAFTAFLAILGFMFLLIVQFVRSYKDYSEALAENQRLRQRLGEEQP